MHDRNDHLLLVFLKCYGVCFCLSTEYIFISCRQSSFGTELFEHQIVYTVLVSRIVFLVTGYKIVTDG